jgi:aminomethyltransferase
VVGIAALRRIHQEGVKRQQLGLMLEGDEPTELGFHWHGIYKDGRRVGDMTNCVWSRRLKHNIGFGLVTIDCAVNDSVVVQKDGKTYAGTLKALPFIG